MNYLFFDCQAETLAATETPAIFSGDRNTLAARFTFSTEWAPFAKTAIFYRDEKNVCPVLIDSDGVAVVPSQVMASKGAFWVGVVGAEGDDVLTSSVVKVKVGQGAISTEVHPEEPAPDMYTQILGQYQTAVRVAIEEHAEKLQECGDAAAECYAAVGALSLAMLDFDGGSPYTEEEAAEDVNGGTPSTV